MADRRREKHDEDKEPAADQAGQRREEGADVDPKVLSATIQALQSRAGNRATHDLVAPRPVQRFGPGMAQAGQTIGQQPGGIGAGVANAIGGIGQQTGGIGAGIGDAAKSMQPNTTFSPQHGRFQSLIENLAVAHFRSQSSRRAGRRVSVTALDEGERRIRAAAGTIAFAWDQFRLLAGFRNVTINAVSAIGPPGCLQGPTLAQFKGAMPADGAARSFANAGLAGVSEAFDAWRAGVTIPGLPWYPSFAAFPGPMAPPTPNIPAPLVALSSPTMSRMEAGALTATLAGHGAVGPEGEALAHGVAAAFLTWLPTQMVMLVMGTGPIPTFAPPYVPVGPVVGGSVLPMPGHLMS